jgi:hypothetical protein
MAKRNKLFYRLLAICSLAVDGSAFCLRLIIVRDAAGEEFSSNLEVAAFSAHLRRSDLCRDPEIRRGEYSSAIIARGGIEKRLALAIKSICLGRSLLAFVKRSINYEEISIFRFYFSAFSVKPKIQPGDSSSRDSHRSIAHLLCWPAHRLAQSHLISHSDCLI